MLLFVSASVAWLQRRVARLRSRQTWAEAGVAFSFAAAVAAAWWYGRAWSTPAQVVLTGILVVAAVVLFRQGWLKLFGPVLFYDLVRTGRHRKHLLLRCLYALLLVYVLLFLFLSSLENSALQGGGLAEMLAGRTLTGSSIIDLGRDLAHELFNPQKLSARAMADLAAAFCLFFMVIQILAIFLLTPAYTASAIAAEKEGRGLEALLTTDLRNREIVLGLLLARVANMILLLLTALPILCFMEFLGGVDPDLMLAGCAAAGVTTISLASIGIAQSVATARPRAAILRSYAWVFFYLAISSLSWLLLLPQLDLASFPSTDTWTSPVTLEDVVDWLSAGNPFAAMVLIRLALARGVALSSILPTYLTNYTIFHGIVALGSIGWAVARLRTCLNVPMLAEAGGPGARRRLWSAEVGAAPLFWKEVVVESGSRRGKWGWLGLGLLLAFGFWPAVHLVAWYGQLPGGGHGVEGVTRLMNAWVRILSGLVGSAMLLQVGLRAAASVSGERSRGTLEALLVTTLTPDSILRTKWLASLCTPRGPGAVLAVVWLVGLLWGSVHLLAVPAWCLTWLLIALFLASLGLFFSVLCRSTQWATLGTLLVVVLTVAGSGLLAFDVATGDGAAYALTPPAALAAMAFFSGDFQNHRALLLPLFGYLVVGLFFWTVAAGLLYLMARSRFLRVAGPPRRCAAAYQGTPDVSPQASPISATPGPGDVPARPQESETAPVDAAPQPSSAAQASSPMPALASVAAIDSDVPHAPRRRSLWAPRVRVAFLLALPLVVVVVFYILHAVGAARRWQYALAEADRFDPGWQLDDLEARRAVFADDQNAAQVVMAANGLLPAPWPSEEFRQTSYYDVHFPRAATQQLTARETESVAAELNKAAAALTEAHRILRLPGGRFPLRFREDGSWIDVSYLQDARTVANLFDIETIFRAQAQDSDGALESCRGILLAGRAMGDDSGGIISMLTRVAMQLLAAPAIERVLAQGWPAEAALADCQRLVEDEAGQPLFLVGLRGERALGHDLLSKIADGRMNLAELAPDVDQLVALVSSSLMSQRAALLRYQTAMVEIAKLPEYQQDAQFRVLDATLLKQPPMVRLLAPARVRIAFSHRQALAQLRCVAVMLAAERYRRQHDHWPETLADLVPAYLQAIPIDPFDGQPLRYRRRPNGAVIYSVGFDLVDNGGTFDRAQPTGTGIDLGVRLWNPSWRRLPATDPNFVGPTPVPEEAGAP
jgi:ABC-type Na+ efflux pump permease subunit